MQFVKINNIEYNIPLSWNEVTYSQAVGVIKNVDDKAKQLSALSGIPVEAINKIHIKDAHKLFSLISYAENLEDFERVDAKCEHKGFDFGSIEYGESEVCRKMMEDSDTGFEAVAKIIKHLLKWDINDEPFLEVIGTANFFLAKLIRSIIVSPNLERVNTALSNLRPDSVDYKHLKALAHTLS